MEPLAECVNWDYGKCANIKPTPPHPPSKVLCKACLDRLDKKIQGLFR